MGYSYDRRTASSAEAERAFRAEIEPGLGDSVMHSLNQEMRGIYQDLAELRQGTSTNGVLKAMLMRHKPAHLTDEEFVKEVEAKVRNWYRNVSNAINAK